MKIKIKKTIEEAKEQNLYFDGEQSSESTIKKEKNLKRTDSTKKQTTQRQNMKKQHSESSRNESNRKPPPINNNMQIKLEPSDIRFIEKIVQQKHGKILTHEEMMSLKKKMVKQSFKESNPYTELNYNTGERNEWKDCMKKTLSQEDLTKLKKHFLHIMRMVDKGLEGKYSLRDLARQFNLDEPAFLQLKRQFSIDPDVSVYLKKTYITNQSSKENSQIQHFLKKRQILQKVINKNPLLTKTELTQKIEKFLKSNAFFPEQEISRIMDQEGYVWRSIVRFPKSRNYNENLQRRRKFCEKINTILTQTNHKVYFLGIMNFNSFMFRAQGWTKDEYLIEPTIDESFTIVAVSERSGQGSWKFQKQIHKEDVFGGVCTQLFKNVLEETSEPKFMAIDIRLFKYKDALLKSRKRFDIEIIWIPPFSHYLNPLQFWFEEIRNSLRKSRRMLELSQQCNISAQKNQVLIKDIYNDLLQVFSQNYSENFDFSKYFEMSVNFHKKGIQMQKF